MSIKFVGILGLLVALAAGGEVNAQSLVVNVRASYSGGGENARLSLGDPVELVLSGPGDRQDSKTIELLLDDPKLLDVSLQDVSNYSVAFTPPPGYWMVIDGVRQTVLTGNAGSHRITLVRREKASADESPIGEPSSIQWLPPTLAWPRWPYLAFNLGSGLNGDPLPPLRIPMRKRTASTDNIVLPDSPEITGAVHVDGGFRFSVPQADVVLNVHTDDSGRFDLTFYFPGSASILTVYHFDPETWEETASGLKTIRVEREVPGGLRNEEGPDELRYETRLSGYYSDTGIRQIDGTWTIEDWHTTTSSPGRVIRGLRTWTPKTTPVWTEYRVTAIRTDTVEVRPSASSASVVSKTISEFNQWEIVEEGYPVTVMLPAKTTEGAGDGDYVTTYLTTPNLANIHGSQAPGGRTQIELNGMLPATGGGFAPGRKIYESWLDSSPYIGATKGNLSVRANGGLEATVFFETDPRWVAFEWPKSVERKVGSTLISKSTVTYSEEVPAGLDRTIVTAITREYSTPSDYIETVTKRFRPDDENFALRNRVYSVAEPSGAKQSFAYASGNWSGTGWTADFRVTQLAGASTGGVEVNSVDGIVIDSLQMHARRSIKTVEYFHRGRRVRREVAVFTDGSHSAPNFAQLTWETFEYTLDGRLSRRTGSDNTRYEAEWAGTRKTQQTDETGLVSSFKYDSLDRLKSITRGGALTVNAQSVSFEYDAAHRVGFQRIGPVDAAGMPSPGQQIVTQTLYDGAGRVRSIAQPGQGSLSTAGVLTTNFNYPSGGRDTSISYSSGATKLIARHADGRAKTITGTAVVHEHYSYGFDGQGRFQVSRRLGPVTQSMSEAKRPHTSVFDLLGRVAERRSDGFGASGAASPQVTYLEYDAGTGLLRRTFSVDHGTGLHITGDRLFVYDDFGRLKAAGLDLDANGALEASSTDRFEEYDTFFVDNGVDWWSRNARKLYHSDGSAAGFESHADTRLTGLNGMLGQTAERDRFGNVVTRTVVADGPTRSRRATTKFADSTTLEQATVGGRLVYERWFDDADPNLTQAVLASTYTYDEFGRVTHVTDARTGSTETKYWHGTSLPSEVIDARGQQVRSYTYDSGGRVASVINPAGTVTYTYTDRGELDEESGSGANPSRRVYTSLGELKQLKTYRAGLSGAADVTEWNYDDNTGWLVAKVDAHGKMVTYDYEYVAPGYRDVIRHSSRNPDTPSTARYALATGDLLSVTHTDGTPGVAYLAYDRLGNVRQVQDSTGVRTLSYANGQLRTEELPAWFNHLVVTRDYHTATHVAGNTVSGRYERWKLGILADPDREMATTFGYDNLGRIDTVTATYKTQGSRSALTVPARYTYKPGSSLWSTLTQEAFSVRREFEANRDVLLSIDSSHAVAGPVAAFGYGTNDAGRREWMRQVGVAFDDFVDTATDTTYYRYHYDSRGQLADDPSSGTIAAQGYRGANPLSTASPLPGRGFSYTYDEAGNRTSAGVSGDSGVYRGGPSAGDSAGANALNQTRSRQTLRTRVSGTSNKDATVTVAGAVATREASPGRYWDAVLPSYQQSGAMDVTATLNGQTQGGSVQALTRPEEEILTYDADGNLEEDSLWKYEWDAEDRLKRMTTAPAALEWGAPKRELVFTYDYLGRRVGKISKLNDAIIEHRKYVYAGWHLMAELDGATSKVVRSYAWGLDLDSTLGGAGGVGGLILETVHTDSALTAYHICHDGSGNVVALVNRGTNEVAASYEYGPFGENVRTQVFDATLRTHGQPFRFSSKYTDSETGLVYYGYRYYDSSMGRFINRDPVGEAGGSNLYGFVANSPVNRWDYLGTEDSHPNERPRYYVDGIEIPSHGVESDDWDGTFERESVREILTRPASQAQIGTVHRKNEEVSRSVDSGSIGIGFVLSGRLPAIGLPAETAGARGATNILARLNLLGLIAAFLTPTPMGNSEVKPHLGEIILEGADPELVAAYRAAKNTNPMLAQRIMEELSRRYVDRLRNAASSNPTSLHPKDVNFSQRSVAANVRQYTDDMLADEWDWVESGPIRVMKRDGQWVAYDNRRLMAAQNANLSSIPVQVVQPGDIATPGGKTWEEQYQKRFNDRRNLLDGLPVPNIGLPTQPFIELTAVP